ncbi:MAG: GntR family transcriptional regulator [Epulopiscium sp. Nele67-Bin004]|nr:MAG: GntR family transcriptional regulator [Epulopiscium sp. Nele67-Bin004]
MTDERVKIQLNDYQPLRDVVFQSLRDAIIVGDLPAGERLMETQLAEKLGVSRTPVREAIRRLETEGLVVMVPRKGAQVAPFTKKDIQDVLEVRAALEALATKLACTRTDDLEFMKLQIVLKEYEFAVRDHDVDMMIQKDVEFHDIIFAATKNDRLIQMSSNIREQVQRYRIAYLKKVDDGARVLQEHIAILEAIQKGDADGAAELATEHINTQLDSILKYIEEKH